MEKKYLFLVLFLMLLFNVGYAVDIDTCQTLNSENTTYELNQSITNTSTCFTIAANNITLEGNNYIVNYSTTSTGNGIYINNGVTNFTLNNITINQIGSSTQSSAIYSNGSNNSIYKNINLNTNSSSTYTLWLDSISNSNALTNITINNKNTSSIGVYLLSSNFNTLNNVIVNSNGTTIRTIVLENSDNNTINKSTFNSYNSIYSVLVESSKDNNFTNNNLLSSGYTFYIYYSSTDNYFYNNTINATTSSAFESYLIGNNTYYLNNITESHKGFTMWDSNYNNISNNYITSSDVDEGLTSSIILKSDSNYNEIHNNIITSDSDNGIYLFGFPGTSNDYNTINNNTITMTGVNHYGLNILGSSNNYIYNNNVLSDSYALYTDAYVIDNQNNQIINGSYRTTGIYDYYFEDFVSSNYLINTNFTDSRNIYLTSNSVFSYNNDSTTNFWINITPSTTSGFTHNLIELEQNEFKFNNTNLTSSVTLNYSLSGLRSNTSYYVYNTSLSETSNPYIYTTNSSGNLPSFSIKLDGETYINVKYLNPILSDNSTNSTHVNSSILHSLKWADVNNMSGYIFSYNNNSSIRRTCYQETANESTTCGVLNTGSYYIEPYYFNINYTLPAYANRTESPWQVKHGNLSTYNITIPDACWNNKLQLRIYSNNTDEITQPYCYNSTEWITIGTTSNVCSSGGGENYANSYELYDGSWTTFSSYKPANGDWWFGGCNGAQVYEEAMWWDVPELTNDTWVPMTGTLNWSNVTKTASSTIGDIIQWKVYANNSINLWSESEIYYYTTTNEIPTPTPVTITPLPTETNDNLTCNHVYADGDGDPESGVQYRWYINGILNVTTQNLSSTSTSLGDNIKCSVDVYDGYENSSWVNSSELTLGDDIAPVLHTQYLSDRLGDINTVMTIGINITETNDISFVTVEITNPNDVKQNITMILDTNGGTEHYYTRQYTPQITGFYTFKFYSEDGSGNVAIPLIGSYNYEARHVTEGTGSGGGGGGEPQIIILTGNWTIMQQNIYLVVASANVTSYITIDNKANTEIENIEIGCIPSTCVEDDPSSCVNVCNYVTFGEELIAIEDKPLLQAYQIQPGQSGKLPFTTDFSLDFALKNNLPVIAAGTYKYSITIKIDDVTRPVSVTVVNLPSISVLGDILNWIPNETVIIPGETPFIIPNWLMLIILIILIIIVLAIIYRVLKKPKKKQFKQWW